jgi:hypothetical protein
MHVERTHHIDASDRDESGSYEYYYEYDLYRFTLGGTCLVARSYADEPNEAHFLRIEERGSVRPLISTPPCWWLRMPTCALRERQR